jgi:hypothetical protein
MRSAAQRAGVAIPREKLPPRRRRLRLVDIEDDRKPGVARLQRRVDEVAGDDAIGAVAPEGDGDVVRRVPRRRHEMYEIAERVVARHEVGSLRLDDRQHAVVESQHLGLGVHLGPVGEFLGAEDIARIGKGRHPAAVFEPRIPADMVGMEMGAQHEVVSSTEKPAAARRVM